MTSTAGKLIAIARRPSRGAPMEELAAGVITIDGGLEGDHKGRKFALRRVTVLAREAWEEALSELDPTLGPMDLPWTVRRSNLLIEGARLPRARGGIVRIGPVLLEVTYPTQPCSQMEAARTGLLKALHPDWRGGICCRVLEEGPVKIGDPVEIVLSPPEKKIRLPG